MYRNWMNLPAQIRLTLCTALAASVVVFGLSCLTGAPTWDVLDDSTTRVIVR